MDIACRLGRFKLQLTDLPTTQKQSENNVSRLLSFRQPHFRRTEWTFVNTALSTRVHWTGSSKHIPAAILQNPFETGSTLFLNSDSCVSTFCGSVQPRQWRAIDGHLQTSILYPMF